MEQSKFFALMSRLKYINRWALMRNTRNENLSEHSLEVAMIAHLLCVIRNTRFGGNVNPERAAVIAMYHDTTEIITGDLPTPVKYNNPEIKTAYKAVEKQAASQLLTYLPDDLQETYRAIMFSNDNGDNDKEERKLVKAADKISALIKCIEERHMGNVDFREAEKSTLKAINEMGIPEVKVFVEEFLQSYDLTLDEQA